MQMNVYPNRWLEARYMSAYLATLTRATSLIEPAESPPGSHARVPPAPARLDDYPAQAPAGAREDNQNINLEPMTVRSLK